MIITRTLNLTFLNFNSAECFFVTGNGGNMVVIITYLETHMSLLTRCNVLSTLRNFNDGDIVVMALHTNDETVSYLLVKIAMFLK